MYLPYTQIVRQLQKVPNLYLCTFHHVTIMSHSLMTSTFRLPEDVITCRLCKDISDLFLRGTVHNVNETFFVRQSFDMLSEVMILDCNMLCSRCNFWIVCHGNTQLIVFVNLDHKSWYGNVQRKDDIDLFHQAHQCNRLPQSLR